MKESMNTRFVMQCVPFPTVALLGGVLMKRSSSLFPPESIGTGFMSQSYSGSHCDPLILHLVSPGQ